MPDERERAPAWEERPRGSTTRREFVLGSVSSALALGLSGALSPAGRARAEGAPPVRLRVFSPDEAALYDAWCDVLAPGAAAAGVSRYLDKQLAAPNPDTLLLLRVLANPPLDAFYRGGIAGIDRESAERFGKPFVALAEPERRAVVDAAASASTAVWKEPEPGFFYFISRADAVDVVWGTLRGFRELCVPYLAHIRPREPW